VSSAQENKALVRRFVEAQANADLDTLDELLAPDFVDHNLLPGQEPGREGFMRAVAEDQAVVSDVRNTIDYQATDGDDMIITRYTVRTRHDRGEFFGLMPTGKVDEAMAIVIHRIVGARRSSRSGARARLVRF
jgi:ketosteroid isomerase-like protein